MSLPFVTKYAGKVCPRCRKQIKPGEWAQFESINHPFSNPICTNPRDLRAWHTTYAGTATNEGICPACGLLHKDKGMCLI